MKWQIALTVTGTAILLLSFQNCAKVKLEEPSIEEVIAYKSGKVSICLDNSYSTTTVDSITVYNLNLMNKGKTVEIDNDGDGLADSDEKKYGFNPLSRRSDGTYLDKICLNLSSSSDCSSLNIVCSKTLNKLGLTDCDYKALGLDQLYAHPQQGLDSDKDGMVDLMEILRGTFAGQSDSLSDPDHDLVRNFEEIAKGSNPIYFDVPMDSRFEIKANASQLASAPDCTGEKWLFDVKSLPWVPSTLAVKDTDADLHPNSGLSLSRPAGTNTVVMVLKTKPRLGETGNDKILFRKILVNKDLANLNGSLSDFELAGEVEP